MLTQPIVGILELASKYRYGLTSHGAPLYLFRPYDETLPEFIVGCSERDTSRNKIAVVDVPVGAAAADPGAPKPRGMLLCLIGAVGSYDAEVRGLLEHYCPARHKKPVIPPVDDSDDINREALDAAHGWITFHVDPAGCRDIDDAIAYNPETGWWAITIADAAAAVPAGSLLDTTAAAIGATFYSQEGEPLRSMLPPQISQNAASLVPGERRRGVTFFYRSQQYQPMQYRWALTWITVAHSFTYEDFPTSDVARDLDLHESEPHAWIAEQMIRYNTAAGELLKDLGVGLLRTQAPADATAVANWDAIHPDLARLGHEAAVYEPVSIDLDANQSHASLGVSAYAHASSPLRRYADLVNQRILKARITHDYLPALDPDLPAKLNARQRANRRWTRDLTFLENVEPGVVNTIDVIWASSDQIWVPAWGRLLRARHTPTEPPLLGTKDRIDIFCDPSQRNWKRRILTAPHETEANNPPPLPHTLH